MADDVRVRLAAVDIAGKSARRDFQIVFPPSIVVPAGKYLAARHDHGSPAFDEAELLERPGPDRELADRTLADVQGIALLPGAPAKRMWECRVLPPASADAPQATLPPGFFILTAMGHRATDLRLGRFSDDFPVELGHLQAGVVLSLSIPADGSTRPWRLAAKEGSARLCRTHRQPQRIFS